MSSSKFVKNRYRFDHILKNMGKAAVIISCLVLSGLFGSIIIKSIPAFTNSKIEIAFPKNTDQNKFTNEEEAMKFLVKYVSPSENYLDFFSISAQEEIISLAIAGKLKGNVLLTASAKINNSFYTFDAFEQNIVNRLKIKEQFNYNFLIGKESRESELAGMSTSIIGSIYTILICIIIAFPIAVCTAIYLEEFAPKNIITSLIEININNLAAVPSIVFGLLGLAVLINSIGLPRSSSITAGITLAMMILPLIIITTRQAFRTIPINIKHAALALGATKMQVILHHTLPLALPGIMTGVILSTARAIGETAPLILIGMVAFIVDIPHTIFDPATVIPVQIFLWASSPERGFQAKTAAAILILLAILVIINMVAVYIRKKYEHRW